MDTKGLLYSKTFWSDALTIGVAVGQFSDMYFHTSVMNSHMVVFALAVAGVVGIYGRKTADTKIEGLI